MALTPQNALTVVARIMPESLARLREMLERIENEVKCTVVTRSSGSLLPFAEVLTLHYARFVILETARDVENDARERFLLFATDFDGPLEEHLTELIRDAGAGLDAVFRNCAGWPAIGIDDAKGARAFLTRNSLRKGAFFVGTRGRTVSQIRRDHKTRVAIADELVAIDRDKTRGAQTEACDIRNRIRRKVGELFVWLDGPPEPPRRVFHLALDSFVVAALPTLVLGTFFATAGLLQWLLRAPCWAAHMLVATWMVTGMVINGRPRLWGWFAPPWYFALRAKEERDAVEDREATVPVSVEHDTRLFQREGRGVQNPMTVLSDIKPGLFRMLLLRGVLALVDFRARLVYYEGSLRGVDSIHFARWVIVPQQRRLLFLSNYDGNWESYLGDFVNHAAGGLNAIWSNVVGYPRTTSLFLEGAADERWFKEAVRRNQILTNVWYSAYPELSVTSINEGREIVRGLFGEMRPAQVREWLERLP